MNESKERQDFCPLEEDVVDVHSSCEHCELWDGQRCSFTDSYKNKKMKKKRGIFRAILRRLPRRRRRFRKGGKGLRSSPVSEEWPGIRFEAEDLSAPDDTVEYGAAGFSSPEGLGIEDNKKKEEYILPELIKEYWDVEPDLPDWVPEPGTPTVSEQEPLPGLLPEDPQSEPFPPGIGPGPDNPLDDMPGLPQDINGPGLP